MLEDEGRIATVEQASMRSFWRLGVIDYNRHLVRFICKRMEHK